MKLFSDADIAKINKVAEKSKESLELVKSVSTKSINDDLNNMSKQVVEYFHDSTAILITDRAALHDYIDACIEYGYAGIDTETTGLDRVKDYIVGASLYVPGRDECYIPLKHLVPIFDTPYKNQLSYQEVGEEFRRLVDGRCKLIFANADFDLSMIYKDLKVDLNPAFYYDVILAWRCLKENERDNALKILYNKYVLKGKGHPMKFQDFFSVKLFPYCKPEVAGLYAANDAKITFDLFRWQLPYVTVDHPKCKKAHLEAIADLIWNVEFPLVPVCQTMHRTGIYVDKDIATVLIQRYRAREDKEKAVLSEMIDKLIAESDYSSFSSSRPFRNGKDFNPKSPLHVKYLVYTMLGVTPGKDGQTTDKEFLHELNLPVTNQVLKVRSLGVLISTFVEKMPSATTSDSRIHAQFKQIGADCIVGDSLVATSRGYRIIEEICETSGCLEAEHVEVSDISVINMHQVSESVQSVIQYTDYPTIKITTEMGFEIEGTYNHPIMVSKYTSSDKITRGDKRLPGFWDERYFKKLEDISVGDFVEIPCNYSSEIRSSYQETGLVLGDYSYRNRKSADVRIPEIYNEEFAEFLGMYHADGAAYLREGTYTISISNDDEDVINRLSQLSKMLFNLNISKYDKNKDINEVDSYISCIRIQDIDRILSHGKQNKKIPFAIYRSPVSVINSYIKGMTLDSSVYTDENGRVAFELSICNELDARFVQMHLVSQGILSHVSYNENKGWYSPRLVFNADNYMLFRDTIGFIESRKYKKTEGCFRNRYDARRIDDSFRVKVKKIEKRTNTVYDLHVPETHSFISNGFISHNTGRLSSAEPNLMNIPSHATDIRHMFRATPATYTKLDMQYDETSDDVSIILPKYYYVETVNGYVCVGSLNIGESVKLLEDGKEVWRSVKQISNSSEDSGICHVFF